MFTPPPASDLDLAWIVDALAIDWQLPPVTLEYKPVGFGSHHWLATAVDDDRCWFVTVDDRLGSETDANRLDRAMTTAWHVRHGAGIDEVVAPLAARDGRVLAHLADGRWGMAVFPLLPLCDPGDGEFESDDMRRAAQRLVARIHAATARVPRHIVPVEDFVIPHRDEWAKIAGSIDRPWQTGRYGELARALLRPSLPLVEDGFARYDALVADVRGSDSPWVITHGEPHAANILARRDGQGLAIVDWDTVALGPKERDLWQLLSDSVDLADDLTAYVDALPPDGERSVSPSAIALYRLGWDLSEIILYAMWFFSPHEDSEDMRVGFENLNVCVTSLARQMATG